MEKSGSPSMLQTELGGTAPLDAFRCAYQSFIHSRKNGNGTVGFSHQALEALHP